ncbi:hypothetical protein CAI21_17755 [Alkalilimnicola ehrlichii]|uniref:Type II secretion system protein GspB C-terminal domain-containing protein n=1 Tax=Alkalilimnicola ehrlichii TaxID=351052 RepID=A0A3E0WFH3_9GAMM|nr:general secretion pathway protein GspB [Alkalilimnicola ehrlichii]RFA26175.1 hypothetical protein CAI21_17755 [Alkalilimnicola ehrlichii]RFA31694.1 hypothetical protein CAL65_21655 [Alkalilimnicola ehrlichii]
MSFILDALKKSEQERQRGERSYLDLEHAPPPARTRTLLVCLLAMGLFLNAAFLGWYAWNQQIDHATTDTATPLPSSPLPTANEPALADLAGVSEQPRHPPPNERIAASPSAPARTKPEPAKETQPASVADEISPNARPARVPSRSELAPNVQERLPALEINVHVYTEDPAGRFALVNLRSVREGDRVDGRVRVERITRTGIIFDFEGEKFQIRAR